VLPGQKSGCSGCPVRAEGMLASLHGPDPGLYFHEDGRLRSCQLAEDFGGQKKNTIWKSAAK
jgi:hypothetical protein